MFNIITTLNKVCEGNNISFSLKFFKVKKNHFQKAFWVSRVVISNLTQQKYSQNYFQRKFKINLIIFQHLSIAYPAT